MTDPQTPKAIARSLPRNMAFTDDRVIRRAAAYSASKFALEGAHEALWYEVRPWEIRVTLVQPGFVHSDGFQKVRYTAKSDRSEHELAEPYHEHYVNMSPFIAKLMRMSRATPDSVAKVVLETIRRRRPPLRVPATPDSVAKVVLKTMRRPRPPLRVPATMDARVFAVLRRLLPRSTYHWLLYKMLPNVRTWGPYEERSSALPGPRVDGDP